MIKRPLRVSALTVSCLVLLSACANEQGVTSQRAAAARIQPQTKIPSQDFAPGLAEETPPANEAQLTNDPSAPANTPLCGSAQQEANAAGTGIYSNGVASGGSCARNACFEPLTGTFIAATGRRSVCR